MRTYDEQYGNGPKAFDICAIRKFEVVASGSRFSQSKIFLLKFMDFGVLV